MIITVKQYLLTLQQYICAELAAIDDGAKFRQDAWQRDNGSTGLTCVLENGRVFEKAGVNFSHVIGSHLPAAATISRPDLTDCSFQAVGLSLVIHPSNPYVPTTHANIRFFMTTPANTASVWWFGGGFDLTPYYGFVEDCRHWHQSAKAACDPFGQNLYADFKAACDNYFYLQHRQEARGIGGIFFDDFNAVSFDHSFGLAKSIGDHFWPAYQPIVMRRYQTLYGAQQKAFQCYRRGRYVEFNLIYDRGTLFGLQSGGRTESILISLPPNVTWLYDWHAAPNSEEALLTNFLKPQNWLNIQQF